MKSLLRVVGILLLLALFCVSSAFAQSYPNKPIRFIVAMPPGGTTDILARVVGQKLTESWGQQVVVDNRGGASGIVGMEIGAKAAPDGYTIIVTPASTYAINPSLFKKLPYDIAKDFAPVAVLAQNPFMLLVHPSLPVQSVKELIALAKSKPRQINYSSVGIGTAFHLAMEMFESMAGINMVHIPYKGAAASLTALLSGEVMVAFDALLTTTPHVKAGRLRALAVTGVKRSRELPDLPTMIEAGVPGYEVMGGFGVLAPAATPKEIVSKLNAEIVKILHMPDVRERFFGLGAEPVGNTPEQFAALIKSEIAKWSKVIKDANVPLVEQ